jgi:hypothetical protein
MHWLGEAAKEGVADGFTAMMMSLWSAALWLLQAVFGLLDQFTSPQLDDPGLVHLYGLTAGLSLVVAAVIGFVQLGLTAVRRDGRSLATLLTGLAQYGAVMAVWVGLCAAVVVGCGGLTQALLSQLLEVDSFSGYAAGTGWVDHVTGTVEAAVLGVCALFLLIPAAFGYLLIMLAREGALLILVATFPIAAAGALGEGTRAWMWKSIRWFLVASLTAPLLALVLGLGVQIAQAAFPEADGVSTHRSAQTPASSTAPSTTSTTDDESPPQAHTATDSLDDASGTATTDEVPDTAANVGMAVVGGVIMLIGCFCPLALFRLLAFVDPGTGSGAAFRSTLAANGGVAGLLAGSRSSSNPAGSTGASTAAQEPAEDGRSASEVSADAVTTTRFSAKLARAVPVAGRALGGGFTHLGSVASQGASLGVDVMGQTGVGHPAYYGANPSHTRSERRAGHRPEGPNDPGASGHQTDEPGDADPVSDKTGSPFDDCRPRPRTTPAMPPSSGTAPGRAPTAPGPAGAAGSGGAEEAFLA